jgi:hypothetical protein
LKKVAGHVLMARRTFPTVRLLLLATRGGAAGWAFFSIPSDD